MNISTFLNSYPGMFITQSLGHSLITALVVGAAFRAWKIESPIERQRFRLLIIILPVLSFPLYQAINPQRGSLDSRLNALLDLTRWLNLEIWRGLSAGMLFLILLSLTTMVFIVQEMVPIILHTLASRRKGAHRERPAPDSVVSGVLRRLPEPRPDVFIVQDDDLVLFATTGKKPAIVLSTGTVESLTEDELQAAIAHEIAHIERNKRPLLTMTYLLRIAQCFNPISLIEFRRIVQEEEEICDDAAVSLTGKSDALVSTLRKFHVPPDDQEKRSESAPPLKDRLEEVSHTLIIESRIARLQASRAQETAPNRAAFALTSATILIINYAVV
jgi:Zn-dependent protease with chaperone function